MNVKAPKDRYINLRQLLSTIHNIWKHYPYLSFLGQKALWIATIAGAANSGVGFEAIRKAQTVLMMAWNQEVSIEEADKQLDALKGE